MTTRRSRRDDDPAPPYDLRVVRPGGIPRIIVRGDIDLTAAPELRALLERAVSEHERVEVDVAGLRTIDSVGIGEFLRAREAARALGKDYALINPPDDVRRLFRVLDITDLFGPSHSR
jgi:anti-sigma B factor antagonist